MILRIKFIYFFLTATSPTVPVPTLSPKEGKYYELLTHSLIHHFETVPNSKKLQTTTVMWLLKDFKIQIP